VTYGRQTPAKSDLRTARVSADQLHGSKKKHPASQKPKSDSKTLLASIGTFLVERQGTLFATISDHNKFTTAEHIANRKIISLVQAPKHVQAVYVARGFHVKSILMDGEFLPLKYDLSSVGIILNTSAANEHVPKIERQIRVIKECVRATRRRQYLILMCLDSTKQPILNMEVNENLVD
jgi:hypothetical protein